MIYLFSDPLFFGDLPSLFLLLKTTTFLKKHLIGKTYLLSLEIQRL